MHACSQTYMRQAQPKIDETENPMNVDQQQREAALKAHLERKRARAEERGRRAKVKAAKTAEGGEGARTAE